MFCRFLNVDEDYSAASVDFSLDNRNFSIMLADGPNGSSFGSYQYSDDKKKVRLFNVSHHFGGRTSAYEADLTEKIFVLVVDS
jgi:hypothetical protein